MARCNTAKKSKAGKEIKCGRCQAVIQPGENYHYFAVGFRGVKQYRCHLHPPRQSELCGSKMSGAYAANEALEDALNGDASIDAIADALESCRDEIEAVRDEYQDSYDNLPENFQNGDMGSDIQEKIDGLTDYADSLDSKAADVRALESEQEEPDAAATADDGEELEQQARDLAEEVLGEFSL